MAAGVLFVMVFAGWASTQGPDPVTVEANAHLLLGSAERERGNYPAAAEHLRRVIGLDPENVDVARSMVQGLGLSFPTLLDRGGKVTEAYRVKGFPTTVVVTPEGRRGFSREGYTAPLMTQLRQAFNKLEKLGHEPKYFDSDGMWVNDRNELVVSRFDLDSHVLEQFRRDGRLWDLGMNGERDGERP